MAGEFQASDVKEKTKTKFLTKKSHIIWILIFFTFLINSLGYFLLWWQIKPDETAVILHYNVFLGIDVIDFELKARYYELFMASASGTFIWLINSFLGVILLKQGKKFKLSNRQQEASEREMGGFLLLVSNIIIQLGLLVYVLAIIRVNA